MEKVCIITLGCKVNQYESDSLTYFLEKAGYEVVNKLTTAQHYIINSCAVTNEAEHKSREYISKIIKLNPNAKIYVAGCSSQLHPASFLEKPNVVMVVGTENKLKIIDSIINGSGGNQIEPQKTTYNDSYASKPSRTRGYIKIQDGCNNFCSYCVIPYTRGRERSRSVESIAKEVERLSKTVKEVVLVGINIAGYGKDLKNTTLVDVAKIFHSYPNLRLRFSSWEMGTISKELLKELKKLPSFCPFFHISLQSASDNVLKTMNRHYTFKDYYKTIALIKKYFPNASISTDIIAGFPTETDEDFALSVSNIKKINFSNIHAFSYSTREGTVASRLKPLNGNIVKERAKTLSIVADELKNNYIKENINKTDEVLIEELKKGFYVGFTKTYLKTYIAPSEKIKPNQIYKVKIIAKYLDGVMGEIIWMNAFFVR